MTEHSIGTMATNLAKPPVQVNNQRPLRRMSDKSLLREAFFRAKSSDENTKKMGS